MTKFLRALQAHVAALPCMNGCQAAAPQALDTGAWNVIGTLLHGQRSRRYAQAAEVTADATGNDAVSLDASAVQVRTVCVCACGLPRHGQSQTNAMRMVAHTTASVNADACASTFLMSWQCTSCDLQMRRVQHTGAQASLHTLVACECNHSCLRACAFDNCPRQDCLKTLCRSFKRLCKRRQIKY